ncbi:MAG: PAS domain S-box protein, partial [Planctomycetes bacterium]|nr:PAS domain S-box protein [Planctomycetota bacterium]
GTRAAQRDLAQRNSILEAASEIGTRLIEVKHWRQAKDEILGSLGVALGLSRVFLYENITQGNATLTRLEAEWANEGISNRIGDPRATMLDPYAPPLDKFSAELARGRAVHGDAARQSPDMQALLDAYGVKSFLLMPVVVNGRWWGLLGLEDCEVVRKWSESERTALSLVAGLLGSTIARAELTDDLLLREERFRALTERTQDLVLIYSPTHGITYVSPQVETVTGMSFAQMKGQSTSTFVPDADFQELQPFIEECFAEENRTVVLPPFKVRHASGGLLWYEGVISNLSHLPHIGGLVISLRNVDERVHQQERLGLSERRFRAISENSADLVLITDGENRVTYLSPQSESVVGMSADDILGLPSTDFVHPDDLAAYNKALEKAAKEPGHPIDFGPVRIATGKGLGWMWVEGTKTNLIKDPAVSGIVCNIHDVTGRMLEQARVEASEERLRTFMRVSEDAIAFYELDQAIEVSAPATTLVAALWDARLIEANQPFVETYGYRSPEHVVGTRYRDLTGFRRDMRLIDSLFRRFIENGFRLENESTTELREDGETLYYIKGAQGVVEEGRLIGFWTTSRDITEERRYQEA